MPQRHHIARISLLFRTPPHAYPAKMEKGPGDIGRLFLGILLYTAGSAILYIFPAYLADLGTRLAIDEAQQGEISAIENIGIGLASLLSIFWITRVDRRVAAFTAAVAYAAFNALAFFSPTFEVTLAARFLTGLCGEGPLFVLAFLVLSTTRNPDRSLGIALTGVVIFGSAVLGATPVLNRVPVGSGALLPLIAVAVLVMLAARWMPRPDPPAETANASVEQAAEGYGAIVAVVAMAVWFGGPGAFWTFAVDAATARQVPMADISTALAVGNAIGLLGSVLAAWQGNRWGRAMPILIGTVGLCLSVVSFQHSIQTIALSASLVAFNLFWNYGTVYQMGLVVALDRTGKATAGISAAQVFGFAGGGFVSGYAIVGLGYGALAAIVAAFAVTGLATFGGVFGRKAATATL